MNNRNFSNRSGGRRDFNRGGFRNRDSGERVMYDAVCSNCGKDCKLPFRPTSDKPVFCNDCFRKKDGGNNRGSDNRRDFGNRGPNRGGQNNNRETEGKISQLLEKMDIQNDKLEKIINLLTSDEPKKKKDKVETTETVSEPNKVEDSEEVVKKAKPKTIKTASKSKSSKKTKSTRKE